MQNTLSTCQRLDGLKCAAVALGEEFGVPASPTRSATFHRESYFKGIVYLLNSLILSLTSWVTWGDVRSALWVSAFLSVN